MKISLSSTLGAGRQRVFDAFVSPTVLERCIPGCETLSATGPDAFATTLRIGVAGLKGTYRGTATIADRQPPDSLTLRFEGKGTPGFVRGSASITLVTEGDATRVACVADVQVGGVIAAVGSRLVEATARKLADDFFKQLSRELASP